MATTMGYDRGMTVLGTLIAAPPLASTSTVRRRMVRVLLTEAEMVRLDRARHGRSRSDALAQMAGLRADVALQSTNGPEVGRG